MLKGVRIIMTQHWVCHNCGNKNKMEDKICHGEKKKDFKINSPGGKCFKKRQTLDKVVGDSDDWM